MTLCCTEMPGSIHSGRIGMVERRTIVKYFIVIGMTLLLFLQLSCGSQEESSPDRSSTVYEQSTSQESAPPPEPEPEPAPEGYVCFISQDSWDDDYPSLYIVSDKGDIFYANSPMESQISWISELEWSPNVDAIAAIGRRGGVENIFIIDVTTDECERITDFDDDTAISDLEWSPNGAYIAFTQTDISDLFNNLQEIAILDTHSRESNILTSTQGHAANPKWSSTSDVIFYEHSWNVSAVSLDGSSMSMSQDDIDSVYQSQCGIATDFDYSACAEYWDRSGELSVNTPRWSHSVTYLDWSPGFRGSAVPIPGSDNVIMVTTISGDKYFCVIESDSYECTILEHESPGGYPYQSNVSNVRWINNNELLFYGNRNGLDGFWILNIETGARRSLVTNQNAQYDFKTWDYVSTH